MTNAPPAPRAGGSFRGSSMKVARLKSGYRIKLSDGDYALIVGLVADGISTMEGDDLAQDHWDRPEKSAWTRRVKTHGTYGILADDEDRR